MGEELMLASQDIYPKKALDHGYKFQFSEIEKCLANIFKKN
jgi:NAD dependent epimerase/dehydratase family enzyme